MKRKFRVWCKDTQQYDNIPVFLKQDGTIMHILPMKQPYIGQHELDNIKMCESKDHQVEFLIGVYGELGKEVEVYENDIIDNGNSLIVSFDNMVILENLSEIVIIGNANL